MSLKDYETQEKNMARQYGACKRIRYARLITSSVGRANIEVPGMKEGKGKELLYSGKFSWGRGEFLVILRIFNHSQNFLSQIL